MKETITRQLTNIVFLVLIVAAALAIFFLSRTEHSASALAGAQAVTPSPAVTAPTPSEPAVKKSSTDGVPESVFTTYLATNGVFSADKSRNNSRKYTITYGESPQVTAAMRYELVDGCLSSVEITFPLPETYKKKGKTTIEAYLYETALAQQSALQDAVHAILNDLLPACDAKSELQLSSVQYWVEQAMQLDKVGDDFEDVLGGYHFLAYRSQGETQQELICILYLT